MAGAPTNTQHSVWHLGELIDTCYCTGNSFSSEVTHGDRRAERIVAHIILNVPVIPSLPFKQPIQPPTPYTDFPHTLDILYESSSSSVLTHQRCAAAESSNQRLIHVTSALGPWKVKCELSV